MCELAVIRQDASNDPTIGMPLRGDVVSIQPDGWAWGRKELSLFTVVKYPGIPVQDFAPLLGNKVPAGHLPLYRAYYLDLENKVPRRRPTVPLVLGD